jgi:hypothetical protein
MRETVREVMAFSGPRMTARHPILALCHLLDGLREPPPHPKRGRATLSGSPAADEI